MYDAAFRAVTAHAPDLAPLLVAAQALTGLWAGVSPSAYQDRHRLLDLGPAGSDRYRPEIVGPALRALLSAVQAVATCPAEDDERDRGFLPPVEVFLGCCGAPPAGTPKPNAPLWARLAHAALQGGWTTEDDIAERIADLEAQLVELRRASA